MAEDFRNLLKEASRSDDFGRWFEDLDVAGKFVLSIQASDIHVCAPCAVLDDPKGYESFELILSQTDETLDLPGYGALEELEARPWFGYVQPGEIGGFVRLEYVPAAVVQQIYEDLLEYARANPPGAPRTLRA